MMPLGAEIVINGLRPQVIEVEIGLRKRRYRYRISRNRNIPQNRRLGEYGLSVVEKRRRPDVAVDQNNVHGVIAIEVAGKNFSHVVGSECDATIGECATAIV